MINLVENTITEQSLIDIRMRRGSHSKRQIIDKFARRTDCEALQGKEKLQNEKVTAKCQTT